MEVSGQATSRRFGSSGDPAVLVAVTKATVVVHAGSVALGSVFALALPTAAIQIIAVVAFFGARPVALVQRPHRECATTARSSRASGGRAHDGEWLADFTGVRRRGANLARPASTLGVDQALELSRVKEDPAAVLALFDVDPGSKVRPERAGTTQAPAVRSRRRPRGRRRGGG